MSYEIIALTEVCLGGLVIFLFQMIIKNNTRTAILENQIKMKMEGEKEIKDNVKCIFQELEKIKISIEGLKK